MNMTNKRKQILLAIMLAYQGILLLLTDTGILEGFSYSPISTGIFWLLGTVLGGLLYTWFILVVIGKFKGTTTTSNTGGGKRKTEVKNLLNKGDVIKTNPREGYWGVAIVLSERNKTNEFDPMCHICITPQVFRHDYEFSEIEGSTFEVLEWQQRQLKPNEELFKLVTVIGVYSRRIKSPVCVIGNIDVYGIHNGHLPFSPDYGQEVQWPLCGNVEDHLGIEAITAWRSIHDKQALEAEISEYLKLKEKSLMHRTIGF